MLAIIADFTLAGGALGAALYCAILGRRLRDFSQLDRGVGGAVSTMSGKVEQLSTALEKAEASARSLNQRLDEQTKRGEAVAKRLELLLASMHDLPLSDDSDKSVSAKKAKTPKATDSVKAQTEVPAATAAPAPTSLFLRHRRPNERVN